MDFYITKRKFKENKGTPEIYIYLGIPIFPFIFYISLKISLDFLL